jgi:hypothetical protein
MAKSVYEVEQILLPNGKELAIRPLKIVYLKELMDTFYGVAGEELSEADNTDLLVECVRIAMKQFCPEIDTSEKVEDAVDMPTIKQLLKVAAGIDMDKSVEEEDGRAESKTTWPEFDLASLESEAFLLGIWKSYEELESNISIPELVEILEAKREKDYNDKKFTAALKGVDLDEKSGKQNAWEEMKARVFSGGKTSDSSDIIAYQGANAKKAGFGIGMGLSYQRVD